MKATKLTREQLYELVWSESLIQLSKKYCISDNGLRKMCKSMNIPLPPNGHWMKMKYGKGVEKPLLPKRKSEKEEVTLYPRTENCNEQGTRISTQNQYVKKLLKDHRLSLEVPKRLSSRPDPLIISTKKYCDAVKRYDWNRGGSYPESIGVLNIDVAEDSQSRAYRIMDTIVKAIRKRGHQVETSEYKTYVIVEGESAAFRLREKSRVSEKKSEYGSREMIPTGDFVFCIGEYGWQEQNVNEGKQRLESKIAVIIAKLEMEGKHRKEQRIKWEKQKQIQEEQQRIAKELQERKDAELKKFTDLFKEALQLNHAEILRDYIERNHALTNKDGKWLKWAKEKINWYDPLVKGTDALLDETHKEKAFTIFLSFHK